MTVFVEALMGISESIMLYMVYEAFFERKENVGNLFFFICYALFALIDDISYWLLGGSLINLLILYCGSLILTMLYKTDIKSRIATPLFMFAINILIEMIVWYFIGLIFGLTVEEHLKIPNIWITGAILSKSILLIISNFVRLRFKNRKLFKSRSYWFLFVVVFLPTVLIDYLLFTLTFSIAEAHINILAIVGSLGLVISSFVVLFLYEKFAIQSEIINREQQYEQQLKSQAKHLDDILVMQNQIKGFRHDIKNHWVVLRGYFQRNDYEGGIQYIDEISDKLISGETIDTGNVALDAIISTKKALAEEKNITFSSTVQIPEKLPIDATDICIIFGNSLDNAIEACEKIKNEDKYIKLSVIFEEDTILCKVANTISKGKKLSMKTIKTDKENHGFGLENIKQALSKYNHVLKIDQTDDEFVLSFIIFNK